jgi:hypothetical protein
MERGDCVMMVSSSEYYSQAPGLIGRLIGARFQHTGHPWWRIEWSNGYTDNYPEAHLILVSNSRKLMELKLDIMAKLGAVG